MPLSLDEAQSQVVNALRTQRGCVFDIMLEGTPAAGPLLVRVLDDPLPDPPPDPLPPPSPPLADPPEPDGWILSVVDPGRAWRLTYEPQY